MKQDQYNNNTQKIVPLSSDEIRSILKSQSESTFEDKNISNNSDFVKKSLIDIALDFKSKENLNEDEETNDKNANVKNSEENNNLSNEKPESEQVELDHNDASKIEDIETDSLQMDNKLTNENNNDNLVKDEKETDKSEIVINDENLKNEESHKETNKDDLGSYELENTEDETKQALDSVRDAVSKSINKTDDENSNSQDDDNVLTKDVLETINKDFENFKKIFSTLSNISETAIFEVFQNKILEIAYELAGYQIDKIPEKYEKKIKSFLKNINCYEDKITIEINDKDFEALSKIKNFIANEEKTVFVPNKELSRGDIVLNCDGMHYSEKSSNRF